MVSKSFLASHIKPLLHPIIRVTYVLVTEKKNRRICEGHLSYTCDFITELRGCRDPAIKIGFHIILLISLIVVLLTYLHGLHVRYDTLTCALQVYKPTVRGPVANSRVFFDFQLVTLLMGEFSLFARAILYYPTTRLPQIFKQYS